MSQNWMYPQYYDSEGLQVVSRPQNDISEGIESVTGQVEGTSDTKSNFNEGQPFIPPQHGNGKICGLRKRTFWICFCVGVGIIVAAAVGGGVGGALSNNSKKPVEVSQSSSSTNPVASATSSSTSSSTTSSTSPLPTTGILPLDCPGINTTTYSSKPDGSTKTYDYKIRCGVNYDTGGVDLYRTETLTFNECIDKCASRTDQISSQPCLAVVWAGNLTLAIAKTGANCYLKADWGKFQFMQPEVVGAGARYVP